MIVRGMTALALVMAASPAWAGDKPLYAPAPDWVVPAPPIDAAKSDDAASAVLVLDNQQRLKDGVTWTYLDTATRATSAQILAQMGNVTIPWMPDRGDLTIHKAEIVRGTQHIDLLKSGERFIVLRREEMMEQRMLTGILTATMTVEGLQVGDVLRVAMSITQADPALKGRVQAAGFVPADPFRAQFARVRMLWPSDAAVKWRGYPEGLKPVERTVGGFHELTVALPLPKQPEMPGDLPARFVKPPIVEATSFADWADVSRTMAPLYATEGLIAPGSPLAAEVATIAAAEKDPLRRTERALELVQDKIRYLALAMNGGGLTPQAPARTWELRYGDCKAKTLMLLAILQALGVEAEAVTVSAQTGGVVAERLPSVGAFDHVLVRATVAGESLWLDGTGSGAQLADIRDSVPFRYGLPLRTAGAALMPIPIVADVRPRRTVEIAYDQSAGLDMPTLFDIKVKVRGALAQIVDAGWRQATPQQRREMVQGVIQGEVGEPQMSRHSVTTDAATGITTIAAAGLVTTKWRRENERRRMSLDRAVGAIDFTPDRSRATWRDIPVATEGPDSVVYRTTVTLPADTPGFALEGDTTLPTMIAGRRVSRTASLAGRTIVVEDRADAIGTEIAPADLPAARSGYAQAQAKLLRVAAPATLPTRAASVLAGRRDGRFKPIDTAYAAAIAVDPEEVGGYSNRASFRIGIYDWQGAIDDLTKVIAIKPESATFAQRAGLYENLGDRKRARADFERAREIDPTNDFALTEIARMRMEDGDAKGGIALLDERIAMGDRNRYVAVGEKAEILAQTGAPAEAVALMDAAIAERPGDPDLLNSRCWVKGIGNVALDTALKDCTKAIQLGDSPTAALDSRALVWFRMGRTEEALADLAEALEEDPNQASSLYLRGVVLRRTGKTAAGDADLAAARLDSPGIDAQYARYGVKP